MPIASNIIKFGKRSARESLRRQALKKKGKKIHKVFSSDKSRGVEREWKKLKEISAVIDRQTKENPLVKGKSMRQYHKAAIQRLKRQRDNIRNNLQYMREGN